MRRRVAAGLTGIEIEPPYDRILKRTLAFGDFARAEETLLKLEDLRQRFLAAGDKKGVEYCRKLALLGRRRAELVGRNRRVNRQKRLQKEEIAFWFRLWLENPAIFRDWLALRKESEEFKKLLEPPAQEDGNLL